MRPRISRWQKNFQRPRVPDMHSVSNASLHFRSVLVSPKDTTSSVFYCFFPLDASSHLVKHGCSIALQMCPCILDAFLHLPKISDFLFFTVFFFLLNVSSHSICVLAFHMRPYIPYASLHSVCVLVFFFIIFFFSFFSLPFRGPLFSFSASPP